MIKNIIIIALITIIVIKLDMSASDVLTYIQQGLDKIQEIVYTIKRSV